MSILQYRNSELMNTRYQASLAKNQGDELTFLNTGKISAQGIARQKVDQLKDDMLLDRLLKGEY
jgi:pyruvate/2-oxoacid:ferredoxin oxidoreductase beta subunit